MRRVADLAHAITKWRPARDKSNPDLLEPFVTARQRDDPESVCRIEDSPFYIFRASGQGLVDVVERLIEEDPERLTDSDIKGWTCLHHAAARSKTKVIDMLIGKGADINAVDHEGNTPLHVAAEKKSRDVVRHLLVNGADGNIKNKKEFAPIHVATMQNHPEVIEEMAQFPKQVDINLGGHNGGTPLHLAAIFDIPEACSKLLQNGCKMCIPCNNGFYPMHMAAKNASLKTLEMLLKQGESMGYTRAQMLSFCDRENNSPLHSAVNSGDIASVEVCLKHGARIDVRQNDQATAFHLAASQGTLSIVKAMLDAHKAACPADYAEILQARDILNMTALHRAAMFDHPEVVRYLIQEGSDVNAQDSEQRSPLLLAAVRCGVSSIRVLLSSGASLAIRDSEKRNVLHFMVMYSGSILSNMELADICAKAQMNENVNLLNQKDISGCTPLHMASEKGNLRFTESLITLGATINLKNNEDRSPLHFAARYGRVNTVRRLLASDWGPNMINEMDGGGMTALHIASMNGYAKVVQLLLHKGALLHKDYMGRTPLHLAAEGGHTQTIRLLLAFHINLLDQRDKKSNSALHTASLANKPFACEMLLSYGCDYNDNGEDRSPLDIAIENGYADVAASMIHHERWKEILDRCSHLYICPLIGLIQMLPEVHKLVLDRCLEVANTDPGALEYYEKYDFEFMQVAHEKLRSCRKAIKAENTSKAFKDFKPLLTLNTMVKYGRVELLSHPVCLQFLTMKWKAYGFMFYMFNLAIYLMFIASLTGAVACLDPNLQWHDNQVETINGTRFSSSFFKNKTKVVRVIDFEDTKGHFIHFNIVYVAIFVIANIFKEFFQIYEQRLGYFFDPVNYTEWTLYVTSGIFVFPLFLGNLTSLQWQCATVAVFLAWFNLLLYLQRLDSVGIYVVMFLHILNTVVRVIMVFSVLFIAFGFTFHILLINDRRGGFYNPFISVIHTILAMMGGWDFTSVYVEPHQTGDLPYPYLNFFFLVLFIILMPILFINLLIGLAVGDIEMVLKDAKLKRLAMQVEYHTDLEERMPTWLLRKVDKTDLTIYPNQFCNGVWGQTLSALKTMGNMFSRNSHFADGASGGNRREYEAQDALFDEVGKTKKRLREVQTQLDKQYDLLRLIVQKMEIVSEVDQYDEGEEAEAQPSVAASSSGMKSSFFETARGLTRQDSMTPRRDWTRVRSSVVVPAKVLQQMTPVIRKDTNTKN
uniref:Transient receptor potential cation channel subfamily A member 1 n=3 Tax=Plectus sambesii TaxID=2011161 RepID=A0A914W205_9BILA